MKTEKLILNYQRRGIKLSVSDNKLHFSAPQNILTDEDKDILKKNKKEIIKFLLDHTESEIIVDEEDKYEKFPLTDIQLSYLVGQDNVYKFGGTNCKIYTEIEYEQIELNKAQYAWEQVIKYNDMLHAVINQEGTQEILSSYIKCIILKCIFPNIIHNILIKLFFSFLVHIIEPPIISDLSFHIYTVFLYLQKSVLQPFLLFLHFHWYILSIFLFFHDEYFCLPFHTIYQNHKTFFRAIYIDK